MTVRIGFLRAVNLGKRRVEMARLKKAVEDLGYDDVWTYINSGNVLFSAPKRPSEEELEAIITDAFGLDISVLVRSHDEMAKVVAKAPKELDDPDVRPDVYFLRPGLSPACTSWTGRAGVARFNMFTSTPTPASTGAASW